MDSRKRQRLAAESLSQGRNRTAAASQVSPPFGLFYQQGLGTQAALKLRAEHFQALHPTSARSALSFSSIDPGHGGGANASRSVIQAWVHQNNHHYLIDQFCEQCDAEGLRKAFWRFVRECRPSVALIEKTADGPPSMRA